MDVELSNLARVIALRIEKQHKAAMTAVATRGFEELALQLQQASTKTSARDVLRDVCAAYLDLAQSRLVV